MFCCCAEERVKPSALTAFPGNRRASNDTPSNFYAPQHQPPYAFFGNAFNGTSRRLNSYRQEKLSVNQILLSFQVPLGVLSGLSSHASTLGVRQNRIEDFTTRTTFVPRFPHAQNDQASTEPLLAPDEYYTSFRESELNESPAHFPSASPSAYPVSAAPQMHASAPPESFMQPFRQGFAPVVVEPQPFQTNDHFNRNHPPPVVTPTLLSPLPTPDQQVLLVRVPLGTAAGETLNISVPTEPGRLLAVQVPPNVNEFQVNSQSLNRYNRPILQTSSIHNNNATRSFNDTHQHDGENSSLAAFVGTALGAAATATLDSFSNTPNDDVKVGEHNGDDENVKLYGDDICDE